ncbi:Prenylated Rab acceptor protein 1 [Halotydeus destructor]|nr:Prenylated Rab acceptor protein 1 [Halotydeus destructor]
MSAVSGDNVQAPAGSSPKAETPSSTSISIEPFGDLDGELNRLASSTKIDLKNLSIKDLYQNKWKKMQTWGSFIDTNKMKTPASTMQWSRRIIKNLEHFQGNYICVLLILIIYCVLTSPLLLLALAASMGLGYIVTLKNAESPLKLFGRKLTLGQQYLVVGCVSFPLFYWAGAGSAVFWVLGASFFIVGLHASLYAIEMVDSSTENLVQPFPQTFTSVQTV